MIPIVSALAAIPKIAATLEKLAGAVESLNETMTRAEAGRRRARKDEEIDNAIDSILDADDVGLRGNDKAGE
jgi:hypothetical protein